MLNGKLNKLAAEANQDYVGKTPSIYGKKFANEPILALAYLGLIGTEVAEAIECVRRSVPDSVDAKGKPEGLPSELADIILRTLIFADNAGIDIEAAIKAKHEYNVNKRASTAKENKCL